MLSSLPASDNSSHSDDGPKRTKNSTIDLLKQSSKLLRNASHSAATPTVPLPRSLSNFISSFDAPKRSRPTQNPNDILQQLKLKPWAKNFTDEQLLKIASERPVLHDDTQSTRSSSTRRGDWRRKLTGILPKPHRPSLDRLNDDLDGKMRRQAPEPSIKKAPARWNGVKISVEDDIEDYIKHDSDSEQDESIGSVTEQEIHETATNEGNIIRPALIVSSSSEEEPEEPADADNPKHKLQTNISAFFTANTLPDQSIEDLRQAGRQALMERQERKKSKQERRIRSAFFDDEAEESESDDDILDDEDETGKRRKTKSRKIKKGRTADSDEDIDEAAIRQELITSRFIDYDNQGDEDHDDTTVYNRLEMQRDAEAVQAIVDRFARDKLDPKARHLNSLADKYSTTKEQDHLDKFKEHGESAEEDLLGDLLIRADSDMTESSHESDSDMLSDYEDKEEEEEQVPSRPSSTIDFINSINLANDESTSRRHTSTSMPASLLSKLDSQATNASGPRQLQGGFTVGNSIVAD